MLLRRITQHVRNQNWFAVFLDFVIVVVGVFIGIQVANWNEERQQKETTKHYIVRLIDELTENKRGIKQRAAYFRQTRNHGLAALQALEGDHSELGINFLVDVYQASQMLPRSITRDSYDEILSIGANIAIPEIEVRKRLATYYSTISAQNYNIQSITPYRETIRTNMPYTAQVAIREACDDRVYTDPQGLHYVELPKSCSPELSSKQIEVAVQNILSLEVKKDLTRQLSNLDLKLVSTELFDQRTSMIIEYLKGVK